MHTPFLTRSRRNCRYDCIEYVSYHLRLCFLRVLLPFRDRLLDFDCFLFFFASAPSSPLSTTRGSTRPRMLCCPAATLRPAMGSMMAPAFVVTRGKFRSATESIVFQSRPSGNRSDRSYCSRDVNGKGTAEAKYFAACTRKGVRQRESGNRDVFAMQMIHTHTRSGRSPFDHASCLQLHASSTRSSFRHATLGSLPLVLPLPLVWALAWAARHPVEQQQQQQV